MTRTEHLLWCLSEECSEVAQRASKAARFGLSEIQEGQSLNNSERIWQEFADLLAVYHMMVDDGLVDKVIHNGPLMMAKKEKVEKYLRYSAERGTL
jgi:hypothetical protein